VLFARAVASIVAVVRLGKPAPGRGDHRGQRWRHMLAETLGHTRMLQWTKVGIAHWFVFIAFGALFFTLITAYGQLFDPRFALPIIGHWPPYEWASEIIAWAGLISIGFLIIVRLLTGRGRESRFFGSRSWQGFYVELTVLGIVLCVLALHAMEYRLLGAETSRLHFPLTWFLLPSGLSPGALETGIVIVAAIKIIISMAWFIVIGLNTTMGVACEFTPDAPLPAGTAAAGASPCSGGRERRIADRSHRRRPVRTRTAARRHRRPRSIHPHRRRSSHQQLPAVESCVHRVVCQRGVVAGFCGCASR